MGVAGRYGPRYGVKIRKQITSTSQAKKQAYKCPQCNHQAVRRVSSGIWQCRRCDLKFAGGAYTPNIAAKGAVSVTSGDVGVSVIEETVNTKEEEA